MNSLPLLDLSTLNTDAADDRKKLIEAAQAACRNTGFLYITGHGVSATTLDAMQQAVREVFAQSDSIKTSYSVTRNRYQGYIPLGLFTPAFSSRSPDQYEGFKLNIDVQQTDLLCALSSLYGPNLWPPGLESAKEAVRQYWAEIDEVSDKLLRLFALTLDLPETHFLGYFHQPLTNMTLLHYPAMKANETGFGIHPHKDSSAFTILYPDPVGGLQVQTRDGTWIDAQPPDGAFVVNIGDVMEHWTGGTFKSTPHRVINRSGLERYSFPYFATPRFDTVVAPIVEREEGYSRPPLNIGAWYAGVIQSNWPDDAPVDPNIDPRVS